MPIVTGGFGNVCSDGTWGIADVCSCIHKARITAAQLFLDLSDDEIVEKVVAHDSTCEIYGGSCCNCEPRIVLLTVSGEIAIDENGSLVTERMN